MRLPSSPPGTIHFLAVVQAKLSSMVGTSSGYLESLPKAVRNRIAFLDSLQGQHDTIEENYQKEKAALEAKYRAMYGEAFTQQVLHVVRWGTASVTGCILGDEGLKDVWKERAYTTSGKARARRAAEVCYTCRASCGAHWPGPLQWHRSWA